MRIDDWRSACRDLEQADRQYADVEGSSANQLLLDAKEKDTNLKEIAEDLASRQASTRQDAHDVLAVASDIANKESLSSMRDGLLGRLIDRALEWIARP